jgi:hypothetical protein
MMKSRMVGIFIVILIFGCSALGVSAPQGKESPATLSDFPYPCSSLFKDKDQKLSQEEYLKDVRKKVLKELEAHKKWLTDSKDPEGHRANFCGAQLSHYNFQGTTLDSAIFQMAMLTDAKFIGITLNKAQLQGANLSAADFNGAHLIGAELDHAMLHRAKFQNADLREASLRHAMLYQAEFHQAKLHIAQLQGANLRDVKGLTQSQINLACLDVTTILPTDLKWLKPPC